MQKRVKKKLVPLLCVTLLIGTCWLPVSADTDGQGYELEIHSIDENTENTTENTEETNDTDIADVDKSGDLIKPIPDISYVPIPDISDMPSDTMNNEASDTPSDTPDEEPSDIPDEEPSEREHTAPEDGYDYHIDSDDGTICFSYSFDEMTLKQSEAAELEANGTLLQTLQSKIEYSLTDLSGQNRSYEGGLLSLSDSHGRPVQLSSMLGKQEITANFWFEIYNDGAKVMLMAPRPLLTLVVEEDSSAEHEAAEGYSHHVDIEDYCISYNDVSAKVSTVKNWVKKGTLQEHVPLLVQNLSTGEILTDCPVALSTGPEEIVPGEQNFTITVTVAEMQITIEPLLTIKADPVRPPSKPPHEDDPVYYTVSIRYLDRDSGEELLPAATRRVLEGEDYDLREQTSLSLEEYTLFTVTGTPYGTVHGNVEIAVYYIKNSEEVVPGEDTGEENTPTLPTEPAQPSEPIKPEQPNQQIVKPITPPKPVGQQAGGESLGESSIGEGGNVVPITPEPQLGQTHPVQEEVLEVTRQKGRMIDWMNHYAYLLELAMSIAVAAGLGGSILSDLRVIRWYKKRKEGNR